MKIERITARGVPLLTPRKTDLHMDQLKDGANEKHRFERKIIKTAVSLTRRRSGRALPDVDARHGALDM
jgi:hypothetical protein